MSQVEATAHAIVLQMDSVMRRRLMDFARTGRITKAHQGEFLNRDLIRVDEYGSLVLTTLGAAALKIMNTT